MNCIKHTTIFRLLALILIVVFVAPIAINAEETEQDISRASNYLTSYNAYAYNAALGKVQVYFHVVGVNNMDDIGALTIKIYESKDNTNWTWVKTYTNGDTPSILGHNDNYYSSHVDYSGTIGRYYKAYICVWAGKDGEGDTRYFWTQPVKATLFAG